MKSKLRLSTVLFGLGIALLLGLIVRQLAAGPSHVPRDKDKTKAERTASPPAGQVDERAPVPGGGLVGGAGIVEPAQRETRIAAASAGLLQEIRVKEGDRVEEGDVLAVLDSAVEDAAVMTAEGDVGSAKANLDRTVSGARPQERDAALSEYAAAKAKAELSASSLERAERLIGSGAITHEELDRAKQTARADGATARATNARYRTLADGSRREDVASARAALAAAEGKLEQARASLERRRVRAPYAGEVLQVKGRVGEYYNPGASEPILVLGDTSMLRARMDVDERDIGRVRAGARAFVVVDAFPGQKFAGKVSEIGRRMGRKNVRTDEPTERLDTKILEVVLDLDEAKGLVSGLRVTAYVEAQKPSS
jgi:HlyD family secretion protein